MIFCGNTSLRGEHGYPFPYDLTFHRGFFGETGYDCFKTVSI
jgi:hypothetical protein